MKLLNLFKNFIPQPPTLLGLTVDRVSLRLVEFGKAGNDYLLRHCSQTPLPSISPDQNLSFDHPEFPKFLKATLQAANITTHQVALALPHSSVLFKVIELDKTLTETDIAIQVRAHAEQYFNYPLSELMMDFELLGLSKKHPDLREVRWIAARRQAVETKLNTLSAAGLTVVAVEVDSFSLHRAADYYLKKKGMQSGNVAVIHLHDSHLLAIYLSQGACIYTHTEDCPSAEGQKMIELLLSTIAQIIQQFSARSEGEPSLILLSGQDASADLIEKVRENFHITTHCLDIFSMVNFFTPYPAHAFAINAGLAMRVIS